MSDEKANLSEVLHNAGSAAKQSAVAAVEKALAEPSAPIFNTHSTALRGRVMAEGEALKSIIADIDAKIETLQAERTDAMLAYSGLTAAMMAMDK